MIVGKWTGLAVECRSDGGIRGRTTTRLAAGTDTHGPARAGEGAAAAADHHRSVRARPAARRDAHRPGVRHLAGARARGAARPRAAALRRVRAVSRLVGAPDLPRGDG